MSFSKLPQELVLTIGQYLPTTLLGRLLCTCHSFHRLLGPELTTRITTERLASTILYRGIRNNHLPTVHLALAHNAAWNTRNDGEQGYGALVEACNLNRLDIVDTLLTHYGPRILTEIHHPDDNYYEPNPLETAIRCNNLARTTFLLERGAAANRIVSHGHLISDKSPLDCAAKYGSAEIAEVLIKHGADVRHAGRSLLYAVMNKRWDVAEVLLREGVSVWERHLPWSDSSLGERSPENIEAWVANGMAHKQWATEVATARRLEEMEADAARGAA